MKSKAERQAIAAEIRRLYFEEGLPACEIMERLGVSRTSVVLSLKHERQLERRRKALINLKQQCPKLPAPPAKRKTHCHRGHPLVSWNLNYRSDGSRFCAACAKLSQPERPKDPDAEWKRWGWIENAA